MKNNQKTCYHCGGKKYFVYFSVEEDKPDLYAIKFTCVDCGQMYGVKPAQLEEIPV